MKVSRVPAGTILFGQCFLLVAYGTMCVIFTALLLFYLDILRT